MSAKLLSGFSVAALTLFAVLWATGTSWDSVAAARARLDAESAARQSAMTPAVRYGHYGRCYLDSYESVP